MLKQLSLNEMLEISGGNTAVPPSPTSPTTSPHPTTSPMPEPKLQ